MRPLLLALFLLAVLPATAQLLADESVVNTRAVIFGVSKYKEPRITSLAFADKDAESFAAFLQSDAGGALPADNIRLLTNEQATSANFFREMGWLMEMCQEGEKAIIYFSGHGDVERVTPDGLGFLLTHDTPYNQYLGPWSVNLRDLQSVISALEAKGVEVVLISDACRSGNLAGNAIGGSGLTAQALARGFQNTVKILSCQPDELSLEGPQWGGGHAAFTYHLIQGLMGLADANKDEEVTLLEIDRYLGDNVSREVAPKKQTPFTDGDRNAVLATVDRATLKQLKKKKEEELPSFEAVATKGFEEAVLKKAGDAAKAAYEGFNRTLEAGQLLQPEGDCADHFYQQLITTPETDPIHGTLTRNFAAALWDASSVAFNIYIKSDSVALAEMYKNDPKFSVYPAYLKRASELLDTTHYMYPTLMGTYNYFQGKVKTTEYFETGKPQAVLDEAIASQEKSLEYLEIASAYYELGVAKYDDKRIGQAIEFYQKAIELSPTWSQPYDGLGGIYRDQERYEEARAMYEKALELSPEELFGPAHRNLGFVLFKLGEFAKAETHLQEALKFRPKDPFTHYYLGSLYREMKRWDDAENAFLKTIQLDPKFAAAFYYLGLVYQDQNRFADAEAVLETAVAEEPKNPSFQYHLGANHFFMEKYAACVPVMEKVLDLEPGFNAAYYYLGISLSRLGKTEEAVAIWNKAIESDPKDPENYYQAGLIYFEAGDFPAAAPFFLQAIEREPGHAIAHFYLGMSYWKQKRHTEARDQFLLARENMAPNADLEYQLGVVCYELKEWDNAEAALMKALELNPSYGLAHYTLGLVYKSTGRDAEAVEALQKAKELGVE